MVKHTQIIRRKKNDEMFQCVWSFCRVGAWRVSLRDWKWSKTDLDLNLIRWNILGVLQVIEGLYHMCSYGIYLDILRGTIHKPLSAYTLCKNTVKESDSISISDILLKTQA